ncbi:hypothetical protein B0H17DRAFT_926096 [Mycena rosella]|uniref:Uncharacterized protein n=1 Tax=Mycena rosella TaxID=1033263 RepID=A0AAD7DUV0_MYCRO|nr:hypothetical protein B0H17DRAFT_926096 [Mycena rosella]
MPRILPRLIKLPLSGHSSPFPRPTPVRSLRKPVPPLPSALPEDYPRSVLLSPGNIITDSHDYVRHKSSAPVHRLRRRKVPDSTNRTEYDPPREMSAQERIWLSSPYLRMLASPLRQCFVTERDLPMVPLPFQDRKTPLVLIPDGLQHPRFKNRKAGHGQYIVCSRQTLDLMLRRGRYKRFGAVPARLAEQITHLLRLRVLQELQLLAKQLEALYRARTGATSPRPPVVRRLTRAEWGTLRTTSAVPQLGALAVLVVPPVNRDPTTKQRPPAAGAMSAAPVPDASQPRVPPPPKRPPPPMSQGEKRRAPHAEQRVPLYNGVPLFPGRVQRAKLHALLTRILGVEGAWRFSAGSSSAPKGGDQRAAGKGDNKGSHAFLIRASDEVDVAPLGVALWRLRMWEGGGFRTRSASGVVLGEEGEEERWPWVEELRSS